VEREQLPFELVSKNLYILVHNVCGLVGPDTVRALWSEARQLAEQVTAEVLDVQFGALGAKLDTARLSSDLLAAVAADPEHGCAGRTARRRLARLLAQADRLELEVPKLRSIQRSVT
jgi:hypothetical protein